jgi:hypothetical protein
MSLTTDNKKSIILPNIILSMNNEIKDKKDEFMERLYSLLTKFNYKVSSRKNDNKDELLIGDMSCWYNEKGELAVLDKNELPKYFKNIDDATNYRMKAYNYHIENVNLNHIAFDVKNNMKYNNNTLKKVYEKICENNNNSNEEEKNHFFEAIFKIIVDYNCNLEIIIIK